MKRWRMTIPRTIEILSVTDRAYVIQGTGEPPVAEILAKPPVKPPIVPPVDPPVDDTPFDWPTDILTPGQPSERYRDSWLIPGRREDDPAGKVYVYLADAGRAAGSSHHNAGIVQAGKWIGYRLWAPHDAPPAMLRQILRTSVWP